MLEKANFIMSANFHVREITIKTFLFNMRESNYYKIIFYVRMLIKF